MAWESHLSARIGFSSSLIGLKVPAKTERSEVVRSYAALVARRPTTTTRTISTYLRPHETTPDRIPTTPRKWAPARLKKRHLSCGYTALAERTK